MLRCLHPDCEREFESKSGRNIHFSNHDNHTEIALDLLSDVDSVKYKTCSNKVGISPSFYEKHFGSWNDALDLADVSKNRGYKIPDEKLLNELQRMSDDSIVRYSEMNKCGKYSSRLYEIRFGSWNDALERAGLDSFQQIGENNPCWKGGHEKYRGSTWENSKQNTRNRANNKCEHHKCNITKEKLGKKLDVHHIVPYRYYESSEKANELSNLILLCPDHHREEESRIWRIESVETVK